MNKKNKPQPKTNRDETTEQDDAIIGVAVKWSALVLFSIVAIGIAIWGLFQFNKKEEVAKKIDVTLPQQRTQVAVTLPKIPLSDISDQCGIGFTHFNGMDGEKLLPETMGGGIAIFDFDNDGDQDVLFVNSNQWIWSKTVVDPKPTLKLFANDGKAQFTDVTEQAGLAVSLYGMGPTVGDFDNDGWLDLFVTAVGKNMLFKNEQGKFVDVTATAGVAGTEADWSTGATFFDYDNDGLLDLFVCNYVQWSRDTDLSQEFSLVGIGRAYGPPAFFKGTYPYLYHNDGNGKFTDVTEKAGMQVKNPATGVPMAKSLGIAPIDVNHDGWQDLVIANDTVANFLFVNQKDGTFRESGVPSSLAFDRNGNATGAMGLDCGYMRNDDTLAIAIGNFSNEPCSLYLSRGKQANFFDAATATGLGPQTRLSLTFGMFFADLDLDGRQDIVCTNGQLEPEISTVSNTQRYEQPPQIFWNAGTAGGTELTPLLAEHVGDSALKPMVGRGAAYADLDNDGDLDMIFIANGGKARILRNDQSLGNQWIRVSLKQKEKNRFAYGAELRLTVKDGDKTSVHCRCITPTRSYLSQCETTATFGLGTNTKLEKLEILWPGGESQTVTELKTNALLVVER
jgi:enediyne biosynthesis protein E4